MNYTAALREKRQFVLSEIESLRAEAAAISARLGVKENQLHNIDDLLAIESESETATQPKGDAGPVAGRSQRFVDAARETLEASGKPLHYRDLAKRLAESGVYVPGQDPPANLLSHMSRDPRFRRGPGRGVYGLTEWPVLEATSAPRRGPTSRTRHGRGKIARG